MQKEISYRSIAVAAVGSGSPASLDAATRSVEVIGATETPVPVYDWERGEIIDEVLLMSGCQLSETRQLPLLDTHSRMNSTSVIGSYRGIKSAGTQMLGRAYFSEAPEAQSPFQKVREGHLTDFSIGYRVVESVYIPDGQRQDVAGRSYTGPLKVSTKWIPRELSICPIGADEFAKARAVQSPDLDINKKATKEVAKMDPKIRAFLEARGLAQTATEEEAYRFLESLEIRKEASSAAAVDVEKERTEAARAERDRAIEVRALCTQAGLPELADSHIQNGSTVEAARKEVFEKVMARSGEGVEFRRSIEITDSQRDKFRAAAVDSLILRGGAKVETPAPGAESFTGYSLRELGREALRIAGQQVDGDIIQMVGRALTTSDLPNILANVANKNLFEGYESAPETWQSWCKTGSVSDFKKYTVVRASETDDLDEIVESGEYKYGSMSEGKEEYQIATYGKLFAISRQTIINDDLSALTDIPRKHGEAAARKVGDIACAVLTANANMGDAVPLFHATHTNLGTAGVPSEITLAEAIKLMKMQKDIGGKRRLNINPGFFIAPVSLEGSAEVFFNSGQFAGANSATTRVNPYAGSRFTRIYEPRLDDSSATAWYLAGPKGKTVTVYFLNGNQAPYLETKQGWNVDGVEYKVRIDAGAKAMDWKAMVKNAG